MDRGVGSRVLRSGLEGNEGLGLERKPLRLWGEEGEHESL